MNVTCMMCKSDTFKVDLEKKILTCARCGCTTDISPLMRNPEKQMRQIAVTEAEPQKQLSDDYEIVGGVLTAYKGASVDVVVPDGVLEIGPQVFKEMTQIRSIRLPEGLKVIRREAFWGCTNLVKINIPKSVELFEYSVIRHHYQDSDGEWHVTERKKPRCFWGCANLTEIVHEWDYLLLYTFEGTAYVENRKALIKQGKCPQCNGKISNFWKQCDNCKISWTTINTRQWGVTTLDVAPKFNLQGEYWE